VKCSLRLAGVGAKQLGGAKRHPKLGRSRLGAFLETSEKIFTGNLTGKIGYPLEFGRGVGEESGFGLGGELGGKLETQKREFEGVVTYENGWVEGAGW
jgi:hypothetical protein